MADWAEVRDQAIDELIQVVEAQKQHPGRSLQLMIDEVGMRAYNELDETEVRRYPQGYVKVAKLTPADSPSSVSVWFVPQADEVGAA